MCWKQDEQMKMKFIRKIYWLAACVLWIENVKANKRDGRDTFIVAASFSLRCASFNYGVYSVYSRMHVYSVYNIMELSSFDMNVLRALKCVCCMYTICSVCARIVVMVKPFGVAVKTLAENAVCWCRCKMETQSAATANFFAHCYTPIDDSANRKMNDSRYTGQNGPVLPL